MSVELVMASEIVGLSMANTHLTIFATAHLYNALQQLGLSDIRRPEMDHVIKIQKKAIFANDVPRNLTDILHRMEYRSGFIGSSKKASKQTQWAFQSSAASAILRTALERNESLEHAMMLLEKDLAPGTATAKPQPSQTVRQQQTAAQRLARLRGCLPEVISDMKLDYILLTRTCNDLMHALREDVESEAGLKIPMLKSGNRVSVESWEYVFMLVCILRNAVEQEKAHRKKKDGSLFDGGQLLQLAQGRFENFVNEHALGSLSSL